MEYKIYKLKFSTPVHFGSDKVGTSLENVDVVCHSDTLFSALCQEILKLFGNDKLQEFYQKANNGELIFSSLLAYNANEYFLPKPALIVDTDKKEASSASSVQKKKMKKLEFISVNDFSKYIDCMKTGEVFDFDEEKYDSCKKDVSAKVSLRTETDKNNIYFTGGVYFKENSGLYLIVAYNNDSDIELFDKIMKSLSLSGIGGKRSSGYGKFEISEDFLLDETSNIEEEKLLLELLNTDGDYNVALSVVSPSENEIDENDFDKSFYKLINRNGFVYSTDYTNDDSGLVKRKSLAMFKEGSCFPFELKGEIKDVSDNGNHPVYKNGKMLKIGVKI